jgi:hypothetical protein
MCTTETPQKPTQKIGCNSISYPFIIGRKIDFILQIGPKFMKSKRENERQRKCLLHPPLFRLLEVVKMSANDCFCEWASGAEAESSERRKRLLGLENITPTLPPFCTWQSNESKQWAVWVARY